jgi:polysaccharide pyruvyl transferase WcaK-like protein
MKNIHIGGVYYGLKNVGDEAILESIINYFQEYDLTVSTYNDDWVKEKYSFVKTMPIKAGFRKPILGFYPISRNHPLSFFEIPSEKSMYKKADLYICGGATILSDCPWYSLRTVKLALDAGTRVILFGVGMAELKESDKEFVRDTCNMLEDIYVRDENVIQRLVDIGVKREKLHYCYDVALSIKPNENLDLSKYLKQNDINLYQDSNKNIAITISGESDIKGQTSILKIKELIEFYRQEFDANIFLVPTNIRPGQDVDTMKELVIDKRCILMNKEFMPNDLIAFMENFEFVLSSRLHMNILSSIVGTPSIGLIRNAKVSDFGDLLGLKTFPIVDIDINSIKKYSQTFINNVEIKIDLKNKVKYMIEKQKNCVSEIKEKYL